MENNKWDFTNIIKAIYNKALGVYTSIKKFFSTLNKYDNNGDKMFLTRSQGRGKRH